MCQMCILLTGKQIPTGWWYQNGVFVKGYPQPLGSFPLKFGGDEPNPSEANVGVFAQKTGFGTFYWLVNSSPHVDAVIIESLPEVAPSPGQVPWKFGGDWPENLVEIGLLLQWLLQGCLHKIGIWHKKRDLAHFAHWWPL